MLRSKWKLSLRNVVRNNKLEVIDKGFNSCCHREWTGKRRSLFSIFSRGGELSGMSLLKKEKSNLYLHRVEVFLKVLNLPRLEKLFLVCLLSVCVCPCDAIGR